MELTLKIVEHKKIEGKDIDLIIDLKRQHWNYSYEDNIKWINQNIREYDKHLMVYKDEVLIGYTNIVYREVILDSARRVAGVGNVCVNKIYKGHGIGRIVMEYVNKEITRKNLTGVLLCKDELIAFYQKLGWHLVKGKKYINYNEICVNVLTYNYSYNDTDITFLCSLF